MSHSLQALIAIGIAVACGAWLARRAIRRLARPGCGGPGAGDGTSFVSSESLARSRPPRRQ